MPPPPPSRKPPPPKTPAKAPGAPSAPATARPKPEQKQFAIVPWTGEGDGEKITIYSESGRGKTTLASMAPDPVFIGTDDGGRKIRNPQTGEPVKAILNVTTFEDLRNVILNPELLQRGQSLVLDTITRIEPSLIEPWVIENIPRQTKNGVVRVKNLNEYGWGDGYAFMTDTFRLLLQDLDTLVRRGVNVIMLAQESAVTMANADGLDFLQAGPKLIHNNKGSCRLELQEWSDHVFRISYKDRLVAGGDGATRGKVVRSDSTRVIHTQGEPHFFSKSRTVTEPLISFDTPDDDSLWRFVFQEK